MPPRLPLALALALVPAAVLGLRATPAVAASAQTCDAAGYRLKLAALTGPPRADLTVRLTPKTPDCALPAKLSEVQVTIFPRTRRAQQRRLRVRNVALTAGIGTVRLGRVVRRQRVAATIVLEPEVLKRGQTRVLLRPDLVLRSVQAPLAVLPGSPFTIAVTVGEPNRDLGATATLTVTAGSAVLATTPIKLRARQRTVFRIPGALSTPGRTRIDVTLTAADPRETTVRNNKRTATISTTAFLAVPTSTIVPSLAGYGGQFNHHVYSALSRAVGVTDENVGEMEQKMVALQPQFSRIFFNPSAFTDPDKMQSFVRTVLLAQTAGTTINITWQGGALTDGVNGTIRKFANVLIDLVQNRGVSNLRWVTLQNEPNSTSITPPQYEAFYRNLDKYLLSIRGQVRYMGGDLVQTDQQVWFDYMATHMSDLLDAWSIHVFWDYWDTAKLQARLQEVRDIWDAEPGDERKPLYVAEYGVRGLQTFNGVTQIKPGVWSDGTPMTKTNISAFQHAWFDILSARLGYLGTSKWDSYFGKYDNGTQAFYMIGPPQEGWPLYPIYNTVHLWTSTVTPGWSVVRLDGSSGSKLLAGYVGGDGQRTVLGLDTSGAQLNTVAATSIGYSIGGLPASTPFHLAIWNADGDGKNAPPQEVTTDAAGVVTVSVPLQSVFALTTVPVHFG